MNNYEYMNLLVKVDKVIADSGLEPCEPNSNCPGKCGFVITLFPGVKLCERNKIMRGLLRKVDEVITDAGLDPCEPNSDCPSKNRGSCNFVITLFPGVKLCERNKIMREDRKNEVSS